MIDQEFVIEMIDIVKRFPGVLANDHVNLSVAKGEVHALLGENGAGKSTLMNILCGLYRSDIGVIKINGLPVIFESPRDAIDAGIGMIHQHFMLVPNHTVAENIVLGLKGENFILNFRQAEGKVRQLSQKYGLNIDPSARIWQLSVGEQQRVEIIKMLYRGAKILIMDEPTAVLTPQEVDQLFETLRDMTALGHTIIFISHKLDEVMRIADRITILRKGKVIATVNRDDTNKGMLAKMMVGREVLFQVEKKEVNIGEVALKVSELHCLNDRGLPALRGISFEVNEGEIFGIAGVAGNGQRELAHCLTGMRSSTKGSIIVGRIEVTNRTPLDFIHTGVGYIPADRTRTGSVPNMNLGENLILKCYRKPPIARGIFLQEQEIDKFSGRLIKDFQIDAPGIQTPSRLLSGGNLQKLILAREISQTPLLMIAVHPTRGLDVGATETVHHMLLGQRDNGAAILMISEDLEELLSLSDRLAVIYEGKLMGYLPARDAKIQEIGLMMAGTPLAEIMAKEH